MEKERNKIQQQLESLRAPIDKGQLWSNITAHPEFPMEEKKRKRRFFWLLFFGALLIGAGMLYLLFDNTQGVNPNEKDVVVQKVEKYEDHESLDDHLQYNESAATPSNPESNEAAVPDSQVNNSAGLIKTTDSGRNAKKQLEIELRTSRSTFQPMADNLILKNNKNEKAVQGTPQDYLGLSNSNSILTLAHLVDLDLLPKKQFSLLPEFARPLAFGGFKNNEILNKQNLWILSVNVGAGYAFHDIESGATDSLKLAVFRNNRTTTLESYFFEAALSRKLKWDLVISLGAQYAMHYQRFDWTFLDDVVYDRNPDGANFFYQKQAKQTTVSNFHRYSFLNLNVSVGKKIILGNAYLQPTVGLGLNLAFQAKGKFYEQAESPLQLMTSEYYENRTKPFFFAEILFAQPIGEQFELQARASMKSKIRLTQKSAYFTHDLSAFSTTFGLAYSF